MLTDTLWVLGLGIGLGLVLHGAPAQATPCDESCGSDRGSRGRGHYDWLSGKQETRDASPFLLKSAKRGNRYVPQVPVDAIPKEFASLSRGSERVSFSADRGKSSTQVDFFLPDLLKQNSFVSLPRDVATPAQPAPSSPVPEPAGLVLFGGGLLVAAAALRRGRI